MTHPTSCGPPVYGPFLHPGTLFALDKSLAPGYYGTIETEIYSKELSLGNQPLETQRWTWPQFLGNWLAGPSVSKKHTGLWKLSAGFGPSFLETGWLAQEVRFPTLSSTYSVLSS